MTKVRLLLGITKSLTSLSLGLLVVGVFVGILALLGSGRLMTRNTLGFGLFIRGGFGSKLGFGLGSLTLLFALYVGIFCGIPGLEDLTEATCQNTSVQRLTLGVGDSLAYIAVVFLIFKLTSASGSDGRR